MDKLSSHLQDSMVFVDGIVLVDKSLNGINSKVVRQSLETCWYSNFRNKSNKHVDIVKLDGLKVSLSKSNFSNLSKSFKYFRLITQQYRETNGNIIYKVKIG